MYFKGFKRYAKTEYQPEINISNMDKANLLAQMTEHKHNNRDWTYIQWCLRNQEGGSEEPNLFLEGKEHHENSHKIPSMTQIFCSVTSL